MLCKTLPSYSESHLQGSDAKTSLPPVCLGKCSSIPVTNVGGLGSKPIRSCFEFCSLLLVSYRLCSFFHQSLVHSWELPILLGKLTEAWENPDKIPAFKFQLWHWVAPVAEMLKGMLTTAKAASRKPCTAYWILELHLVGTPQPEVLSELEDLIRARRGACYWWVESFPTSSSRSCL